MRRLKPLKTQDARSGTQSQSLVASAARYHDYFINRISNPDPAHSKWSGYASIYWSDSNADGRQDSSEVCRISSKVDAVTGAAKIVEVLLSEFGRIMDETRLRGAPSLGIVRVKGSS